MRLPPLRLLEIRHVNQEQAITLGAPSDAMEKLFGDCQKLIAVNFEKPEGPQVQEKEATCRMWRRVFCLQTGTYLDS